jgi:hypothetical protein
VVVVMMMMMGMLFTSSKVIHWNAESQCQFSTARGCLAFAMIRVSNAITGNK